MGSDTTLFEPTLKSQISFQDMDALTNAS